MPTRRSRRIYVRARTDPQSAQLWWPGLGAARLAGPGGTDGRTDGSRYRLMSPYGGGANVRKQFDQTPLGNCHGLKLPKMPIAVQKINSPRYFV